MPRQLPYNGYTWSFTQHAAGFDAKTVYDMLKCAAPFEGQVDGYGPRITALMVSMGILTPNERDGQDDAWRDYQQILAEMGLIYSTRVCPALTITEIGHMYLAGDIGFSELIGVQALRYQYPNGQKFVISSPLRQQLNRAATPATLIELQIESGVLVKPAVLVLRVLLELLKLGRPALLSVDECQAFLLPCRTNAEWPAAVSEIANNAQPASVLGSINRHSRRNIQDWFKFLCASDFFYNSSPGTLTLSNLALSELDDLEQLCIEQEDPSSFWIPTRFDANERLSWFDWFGANNLSAQRALRTDILDDVEYQNENYVAGLQSDDEDDNFQPTTNSEMNLISLDIANLGKDSEFLYKGDLAELADRLVKGAQKRHAKTILHDRLIKQLAETFVGQGANVSADRNSVDLMVSWPDNSQAIFEVKTVTRRSLQGKLRTAVGQIQEYDYRLQQTSSQPRDKIIVINSDIEASAWQTDFLTNHLQLGLITITNRGYGAFSPTICPTYQYWAN